VAKKLFVGGLSFDELLSNGSSSFTMEKSSAEDPVLLMYTSGTTGNPKGVLHVARYVLGHNGIDYSYNYLRDGDLYYSPADWAWAGGLLDGLLAIWPYGIPVLAYRSKARFDPDVAFRLLEKHGATVGLYPPTALKVLREIKNPRDKYKLKLRCIVSGAEPVSPQLARWVDEELQVEFNQGFGQTEANYFIGTCSAIEKARLEPLGKPYPGHDVAIVSQEGEPLKTGEAGEIAIRRDSPVVMREYWKNPAAMSEKFKGEPRDGLCRFFDKRMTVAIALRCGSKDLRRELCIVARKSMTRPVGESITVAAELTQNIVKQRRGGKEIVEAQRRAAQGAAAYDGARTLIAQGKAETADAVTLALHQSKTGGSGAGNDNAAISAIMGTETGRISIDVDADGGEGPQSLAHSGACFFGVGAGETKADMQMPSVLRFQSCLCQSFGNRGENSRNGGIQVRIEIGKPALCLAQQAAILAANADPTFGAAAIDSHEQSLLSHMILLSRTIPK
jgi:hypothetical protein